VTKLNDHTWQPSIPTQFQQAYWIVRIILTEHGKTRESLEIPSQPT
jgi:hypothetical protein